MMYSSEPSDPHQLRQHFDTFYTRFAPIYGWLLTVVPWWTRWTSSVLPHVVGRRVLEVACGTGHLLLELAHRHAAYAIDFNRIMSLQSAARLKHNRLRAPVQTADVERIPYADDSFDSVVCTMAFSGFPEGRRALLEMRRVLRPGGVLAIVDVNFPADGDAIGTLLTRLWQASGDVIRDMPALFRQVGWSCRDQEIGGRGSVHLYLAEG